MWWECSAGPGFPLSLASCSVTADSAQRMLGRDRWAKLGVGHVSLRGTMGVQSS